MHSSAAWEWESHGLLMCCVHVGERIHCGTVFILSLSTSVSVQCVLERASFLFVSRLIQPRVWPGKGGVGKSSFC